MSDDFDRLLGQFAGYAADELDAGTWRELATEFGVQDLAEGTRRFFRSYRFGDGDRVENTRAFLRAVRDRDRDLAARLLVRAYDRTGGATAAQFDDYPALRQLDRGASQPPAETVVASPTLDPFLELENVPGDFYESLVQEINTAYQVGVYGGAAVLCRKLLENLLIDVLKQSDRLRAEVGDEWIGLFYNSEEHRYLPLSTIIEKAKKNDEHIRHLAGELGPDLLDDLDDLRTHANSDAHSIEMDRTREEFDATFGDVEHVARVLIRARANAGGDEE